jgi:hypothetical protein
MEPATFCQSRCGSRAGLVPLKIERGSASALAQLEVDLSF